ncbi:CaiB/BaiF CoA transferase family protein [Paracraurococcus lichenis]|uniref:CaiB/BaiF CoA-transferase family protein n=1 Tax=Paracraurococcus lichenis TaxID=3064888 RepID=A0ABT9DUV8_9PROT|nr:CaiB/BaiF CoA-transferase family protein [Paracraurococcus sp. LOR1-02]MDO9707684.1 CaiB/BaiF CoA-transferase family protein [Paracraurococcus sp. LOR1-02]
MGPLKGLRILEFAGIGPGPFCAMVLADLGAEVVRIDRKDGPPGAREDFTGRGRRSVALDLKSPAAVAAVLRLCDGADALIEGFRPGVMERLGLGPDVVLGRNPRLVYGRMTGWGQEGPLAQAAGHDMNYIALTGALWSIGRPGERPVPPLNLVGDYGGGGMLLAVGLLAALLSAKTTGQGQVVDAAMVDGAALLMAPIYAMKARGRWRNERGSNMLDGAAPWYDTYECADGRWLSVGPIEPQFFALLCAKLGLDAKDFPDRMEPAAWPALKERLTGIFRTRTRDDWCGLLEGTDACVAPVLDMEEAPRHPHTAARGTFALRDGVVQPAPAPRFSATPAELGAPAPLRGEHTEAVLQDFGFTTAEIAALRAAGAAG